MFIKRLMVNRETANGKREIKVEKLTCSQVDKVILNSSLASGFRLFRPQAITQKLNN
jgi:hypothetical protein